MPHMQTRGGAGAPHAITFKVQKAYGVKPATANAEDGDERVDIAHWVDLDGPRSSTLRQASPLVIARHVLHQLGAFLRRPLRMLQNRYQLLEQHNQALAMLVGNANSITVSLFSTANTLAALLANTFPDAQHKEVGILMYAALVLLGITLVVNMIGAFILQRASSGLEGAK